jgi:hypothetical protein
MLKHKFLFLALGASLAFTACKKTDAAYEATQSHEAKAPEAAAASFKPVADWKSSQQDKFRIQYGSVQDSAITADIVSNGLVLVYAKDGNNIQSLPFQSQQSDVFWYYQIAEGSVLVSCDVYGSAQASAPDVRYFIFSKQKLSELEKNGRSKADLVNLSYDEAKALVNQ